MANIPLKTMDFKGLSDTYTIPTIAQDIGAASAEALASETSARAQEDIFLNNRIDNIIANQEPSEGNTELIDIRTSASGNIYNTAGDAVRSETADLARLLGYDESTDYNFKLRAIASASGEYTDSTTRIASKKIKVTAGTTVSIVGDSNASFCIARYNLDGTYKGSSSFVTWATSYTVIVDEIIGISIRKSSSNPIIADSDVPILASAIKVDIKSAVNNAYDALNEKIEKQKTDLKTNSELVSEAQKTELFTDGHLKEISLCYDSTMKLWNTSTQQFLSTETTSTDYILVDSDVYISFENDASAFNNTYIRVQFYDVTTFEFKPEILVRNTASTGVNNIYTEQLKTIGFRVAINSPVYMKVAKGNAKNVRLFTWDKEHFGLPLAATATMIDSNGDKIYLPREGYSCVTIPKEAKFIFAKDGYAIINLWACRSGGTYTKRVETNAVPTQCLTIPKVSGDLFYRATVVKNYNYSTGEFEKYQYCGDNDAISVYTDSAVTNTGVIPNGKYNITNAKTVLERAKKINSIEWTCLKDTDADGHKVADGKNGGYKAGVKYRGVPYGTSWTKAHWFGWHVSAHTFLSAANDIDSIFYTPAHDVDDKRAPYYSLVCSSYTTLAGGFLCPHQNFSLMNNPKVQITQLNAPQAGQMATNGIGHCIIYGETYNSANTGEIEFCECASPLSKNSVTYSDIIKSNSVTVSEANNYTGDYRYFASDFYNPNRVSDSTRIYPIEVAAGWTPTNGTARPYKGDKSVYTSAEEVKINIKDATATTLYYSKCDNNLALTGTTYSKTFAAGTTQTTITEHLSDGLWAVWTNKGNDKEYFEYHDVSNITISVNVVDGNFVFDVSDDNPWWYVVVPMHSKKIGFYPPDDDSNFVSITYEASGNYSDYLEYATYISGNCYFFRKGTFGAYVINQ